MEIQRVNCLIGLRQKPEHETFNMQFYKCGVDAMPVTEIAIHQAIHGNDSVTRVSVCDSYETTKKDEYDRLLKKYRPEDVALCYPTANVAFPRTVADIELEPEQFADGTEWVQNEDAPAPVEIFPDDLPAEAPKKRTAA